MSTKQLRYTAAALVFTIGIAGCASSSKLNQPQSADGSAVTASDGPPSFDYTIGTRNLTFSDSQSHLLVQQPPASAPAPTAVIAAVKQRLAGIPVSSSITLEYGVFTDDNDVENSKEARPTYGLINRSVWTALLQNVPPSRLPGPAGSKTSGTTTPAQISSAPMYVLYVFDGATLSPLESVQGPQVAVSQQ